MLNQESKLDIFLIKVYIFIFTYLLICLRLIENYK